MKVTIQMVRTLKLMKTFNLLMMMVKGLLVVKRWKNRPVQVTTIMRMIHRKKSGERKRAIFSAKFGNSGAREGW